MYVSCAAIRSRPAVSYLSGSRSDGLTGETIRRAISPKIRPSSSPKAMMGRRRMLSVLQPHHPCSRLIGSPGASPDLQAQRYGAWTAGCTHASSLAADVPLDGGKQLVQV